MIAAVPKSPSGELLLAIAAPPPPPVTPAPAAVHGKR
jgi:hypothetical protein